MGQVVELISKAAVDQAWTEYAECASRLSEEPRLIVDRDFNERCALLHDRWSRLFLTRERMK